MATQAELDAVSAAKVTANAGITGATKTKVTYDAKGLVTAGADATSSDVGLGNVTNVAQLPASYLDTDGTLAANSDTKVPSQKATKSYVDAVAQGLSPKQSVQEATAAALPTNTYLAGVITITATGTLTVDGQVVALNDRVLVQNETPAANNGIYLCTTAGAVGVAAVLTRATDSNTGAKILGGFVFVELGTVNASSGFVNTNATAPTIGTTAITYTQFSGAGEITAGSGLAKSGNTLSVATGGVTSAMIADGAIVNADVNTSAAIVYSKLSLASSIVSADLVDGTVVNADLANMAAKTVKMRHTNSTGAPEDTSMANLWTDLSAQAGAAVSMNSQNVTALAAATAAGHATRWEQVPHIYSGGTGWSHTGDTVDTALVTVAIAAGEIGANGGVVIYTLWARNAAGTNTVQGAIRFGATGAGTGGTGISGSPSNLLTTAQTQLLTVSEFANANNASSQIIPGQAPGTVIYNTPSGTAIGTGSINTGNATEVCISGKCVNSGDTVTLKYYRIIVYPSA